MPETCPDCGTEDMDTEEDNDALKHDEEFDYFCPFCGGLFKEEDL